MFRIKRTKTVEIAGQKLTRTHYATKVTPVGVIEGWSETLPAAVAITEGVARRIKEFYAGKKNVGELVFETLKGELADLATAVVSDDAVGVAEFARLQEECKALRANNASLQNVADQARADSKAALAREQETKARLHAVEQELSAALSRNTELAVQLAEAEQALNQPPPSVEPPSPPKQSKK